jgi:glycosyltransferase involved in cell wall biosynthesis
MSVFVAPVWQESFGQVSCFAMSMRLPVAGYDVGALPEILGDRSALAPPGDTHALAEVLLRLLDDRELRLAIGQRNLERVHRSFTVEAMVDHYRALYRELLGMRR